MQVTYPIALQTAAKELGVILPTTETVDNYTPMVEMAQEMSPGADFGFSISLKKLASVITHKSPLKAASKAAGSGIIGGHVIAFGVPISLKPKSAMAAADRLLGDKNLANAQAVIRNTHALAALGDPAAKRGLAVLQAVGHIRVQTRTPPGKMSIPMKAPPLKATTIKRAPVEVRALAAKTPTKKQGVFRRLINWLKSA